MTRQVRFMIGQEFFWTLEEAMKYRRKHGGEIRQVYSTIVESNTKRVNARKNKPSKYDPSAPLPDILSEFVDR